MRLLNFASLFVARLPRIFVLKVDAVFSPRSLFNGSAKTVVVMSRKPARMTVSCLIVVSVWLAFGAMALAGPWKSLNPFKSQVDADPQKKYLLSEDQGPWMILATTFAGENAEQEAHTLVLELRKEYGLAAYLHKKRFDFSGTVDGRGVNRFGDARKLRYRQNVSFHEWAVLVGDFSSIDLPEVKRTLDELKTITPESLDINVIKTQRFRGLREAQQRVLELSSGESKRRKGPMRKAFVTRNPLLPKEFFVPSGIDKFIYNLNKDLKHSLVLCQEKYTVRVARFQGNAIVDQRKIDHIRQGAEEMTSRLAVAAAQADKLTTALRELGVEAYQFHDRTQSIVTVGSFESVGTRRGTQLVLDSEIRRVIEQFRPEQVHLPNGGFNVPPKVVEGIPCDPQPVPIEVPRYSVSSDYAQLGIFR